MQKPKPPIFPRRTISLAQLSDTIRVYHFLNAEFGLQAIQKRRIKISRIESLNDDFEMMGLVVGPEHDQRLRLNREALNETTGIICTSKSWRSPLLWGHYADRMQGICLGLDVPRILFRKIEYVGRRPRPQDFGVSDPTHLNAEQATRVIFMKAAPWRYEQEYRAWLALKEPDPSGLYFKAFAEDMVLREVIVGQRSSVTKAQVLTALASYPPKVEVMKAKTSLSTFKVIRNRTVKDW